MSRGENGLRAEGEHFALCENDLMGRVKQGGGRGLPFQPHVQQARPPGGTFSLLKYFIWHLSTE